MLRWRLSIGLVTIFILLIATGAYSILLFYDFNSSATTVLSTNYDQIRQAHRIRAQTSKINSFYMVGALHDVPVKGRDLFDHEIRLLKEAVDILASYASSSDADRSEIRFAFGQYRNVYEEIFAITPDTPQERQDQLREQMAHYTQSLTEISQRIIEKNEQRMAMANKDTRKKGQESIQFLLIAMVTACAISLYTYYRLGRSIIDPLQDLNSFTQELTKGNFEHSIPIRSSDELGKLAESFNDLARELYLYKNETTRKYMHLNLVNRATLSTLPYPIFILNENSQIEQMNPAAEKLLADLQIGIRLPEAIKTHVDKAVISGADYLPEDLKESVLFRIHEEEYYYLPRTFRIMTDEGSVYGNAVMLFDVTRFRWLDQMKTNMLSTVSHEVKTPLTGIRMVLHILMEQKIGNLNQAQNEMVSSACNDCERLLKTLNVLLDLSKVEQGERLLERKPIPPRKLLQDSKEFFEEKAKIRAMKLEVEASDSLPPVSVDVSRIEPVLNNLLSNAIKYGNQGTSIRLKALKQGPDFVRFFIRNQGTHIPEEHRTKIFDRFYRIPGESAEGAGLGLSIAREIIQAHGGKIGVNNLEDNWIEFYCDLPIA